ncbi:MAG: histidine kinase dimerization/phospho-acceptor domain-containing protein, partial [Cyanobium sp.]
MSLADLRALLGRDVPLGRGDEDSVRRQWWAALATLQEDLLSGPEAGLRGLWLAAPLPALYEPRLLRRLQGWVWAPTGVDQLLPSEAPLLPGRRGSGQAPFGFRRLPLHGQDGTDPLLILITPALQVALALDGPPQRRRLIARFDAAGLSAALELVLQRIDQDEPAAAAALHTALQALGPLDNSPELALRFWPLLAERLAAMAPSVTLQPLPSVRRSDTESELALLEALTHEVRTPLATIRTLIRSLLRRQELSPLVRQRLEQIDSECSEQIDRFGLIFLAAEPQRQPGSAQPLAASELARTDLSRLLEAMEPLWQR